MAAPATQVDSASVRPAVPTLTIESAAYVTLALVAAGLRLAALGAVPLTPAEATEALSAHMLARGLAAVASPLPGSQLLNSLQAALFWLVGASDAAARLWPALVGTAIALAPGLFRRQLGRTTALVASLLLVISPTMLAASRSAHGAMLALGCAVALLHALARYVDQPSKQRAAIAGMFLGLGLTSGPQFVSALFVALAAYAVNLWLVDDVHLRPRVLRQLGAHLAAAVLAAAAAFVGAASLAGLNAKGLSAAGATVPAWLSGWLPAAAVRTPLTVPSLIVVYEPLALALGIGGAVLAARGDRLVRRMLVSVVVGLAFGIVYSGRDSWDALWVAIPLAIAAAHVVVRTFAGSWDKGEFEVTVGQTAILLLLIVFAGLNLATFANAYETSPGDFTYLSLGLALGVAALYVLSATLFASGWTTRCALRAVVASVVLAGLAVTVRAGWGVAFANAGRANELWRVEVTSPNARLMVASVEAISLRHVGDVHDVGITVQGDRNGALGWYLREFTHVVWVDSLGPAVNTPVIITPEFVTNPALGSSYLGESFAFVSRWDGRRQHPAAFVGYALFRAAPGENEHIVVWVREDVQLLRE